MGSGRTSWAVAFFTWLALIASVLLTAPRPTRTTSDFPRRLTTHHLANVIQLTDWVISGAAPEGEASFAELRTLGVQTIVSVDGASPDLALASRYGIRYVHLPHGYDGIDAARGEQLAQAVQQLPKPIYMHCHHGKHRSPAAAAVACQATGQLTGQQAQRVLELAGTNPNYHGLYQAVKQARPLPRSLLNDPQTSFPDRVDLPPLVDSMVALDELHALLQLLEKNDWQTPADQPAQSAVQTALLFAEQLTELDRADETQRRPEQFRRLLSEQLAAAQKLQGLLDSQSAVDESQMQLRRQTLSRVSQLCADCHRQFRDPPKQ